ncbi:unnamed protein product, partial [Rotaria sp. Silwood2]
MAPTALPNRFTNSIAAA